MKHIPKRLLSIREKNLIIILIAVVVIWAISKLVARPQYLKIQKLEEDIDTYSQKVSEISSLLKKEESINKDLISLDTENRMLSNSHFLSINQSEAINLLNRILGNGSIEVKDVMFSEPFEEDIEGVIINRTNIDIPYMGDYNGIIEILNRISSDSKKIKVNRLIMDKAEDDLLSGTISLGIYSLDTLLNEDYSDIKGHIKESTKSNPFEAFDSFTEEENVKIEDDEIIVEEHNIEYSSNMLLEDGSKSVEEVYQKEILEDFEEGVFDFIPSSTYTKGNLLLSQNSKSKNNSLRLEYNILAIDGNNKVFINLFDRNILIKYPPSSIGIWIYSFGYSPATVGLRLRSQDSEQIDINICEGIYWIGWNYIEISLPADLKLYPLQIDKIYLELLDNRDDFGVLLFDKLEANYPKDSNKSEEVYTFHVVKEGETLDDISIRYYNTKDKKDIIMKYNEMETEYLYPGRILVLPR